MRVARAFGRSFGDVVRQPYAETLAADIALRDVEHLDSQIERLEAITDAYRMTRAIASAFGKDDALKPERDELLMNLRTATNGESGWGSLTDSDKEQIGKILQSIAAENERAAKVRAVPARKARPRGGVS